MQEVHELQEGYIYSCKFPTFWAGKKFILANSLLFGQGKNSAKIEIGEEIKDGKIQMCA